MAAPADTSESSKAKVQIRLSTRHDDVAIADDPGTLLVSTNFRRLALSTLVNNLLQNETPIPFEFLINGLALRTTIEEFLAQNGISAETVLNVEYFRALVPPQHKTSFQHDDWVSSVDVLRSSTSSSSDDQNGAGQGSDNQTMILSGSYDGLLRLWSPSSELLATSSLPNNNGRVASIKAANFISPTRLVSGGTDMTVRIWKYTPSSISLKLELYGHKNFINSFATHSQSQFILSASADQTIGLWDTRADKAPPAPSNLLPRPSTKRQKLSAGPNTANDPPRRGPIALLSGHTSPVASTIFSPTDPSIAYSASHDHTLRTWDLETHTLISTLTLSSSLASLLALPALSLLATGSTARHITLSDPRASAISTIAMTMRGHTNAVVALARNPSNEHQFVSGSHDGTCRIWDVRQVKPGSSDLPSGGAGAGGQEGEAITTIERESLGVRKRPVAGDGVKVFGVVWDEEVGIVSGGEDKRVQIDGWR